MRGMRIGQGRSSNNIRLEISNQRRDVVGQLIGQSQAVRIGGRKIERVGKLKKIEIGAADSFVKLGGTSGAVGGTAESDCQVSYAVT